MAAVRKAKVFLWTTFILFNVVCFSSSLRFPGHPSQYSIWPKWYACVNASLNFEFRTTGSGGLLLYTDDGGTYDFFQVVLHKGKVNLTLNIVDGNDGSVEIVSDKVVNDGKWHKVTISRNRMETTLKVDTFSKSKVSIGSDFLFGRLPSNSPVYIGGLPPRFRGLESLKQLSAPSAALIQESFSGSIRNVLYNNCTCKTTRAKVVDYRVAVNDREACDVRNPCTDQCLCLSNALGPSCDCTQIICEQGAITYYHLPMDSVLGSTVVNPSGLDATVIGSPDQTAGVSGQALVLNGKRGQYIKVTGPGHRYECFGDLDKCPRGYTLMAWLQFSLVSSTKAIYISNGGHSRQSHGIAMMYSNGLIEFVFRRSNGEEWHVEYDNILADRWYHVTATWKNSEGLILYIDGDAVAKDITPTKTRAAPKFVQNNDFVVGRANNRDPSGDLGTMMIDELKFWSEARSANQIRESGPIYKYHLPMDDMSTGQLEIKNMLPRVFGSVDIVPGKMSNALSLNGEKSYIDLGSYSHSCLGNLDLCQYGFYLSLWISFTDLSDNTYFIATGLKGTTLYYTNRRLYASATSGDKTWTAFHYRPQIGRWYFVEISWKKATSLSLYVDQQLVHVQREFAMDPKATSSFTDFYIGRANSDMKTDKYAAALFDNIEIYFADRDTLRALQLIQRDKPERQYFPFEEIIKDRIPHTSYLIRTYGHPSLNQGKIGQAILLQAVRKQYIDIGEHSTKCIGNLDICPNGVTVSLWLRVSSLHNDMIFISTGSNGFVLSYEDKSLTATFKTSTREWKVASKRIKTSVWYHLEFSWHPEGGLRMYINGDLAEKTDLYTRRYKQSQPTRLDHIYIGTDGRGRTFADATFDELEFWYAPRDYLLAFEYILRGKPTNYLIDMEAIRNGHIAHPTLRIPTFGNPQLVAGKIGKALRLTGDKQYIDVGDHRDECMGNLVHCKHGITVTFWIKFAEFTNYMYYLSTGSDGARMYYHGGYVFVVFGQPGKIWQAALLRSTYFEPNRWYFVEISWQLEYGLSVYVNNKRAASIVNFIPRDISTGNLNHVYFGRANPGDTRHGGFEYGNVTLDEVEIWYARRDELVAFNHVLRDNIAHETFSMEAQENGKLVHPKYDDVTLENGASIVPGRYGNGVYLNGNRQFVSLGDHRHSCIGNLDFCRHGLLITMWLRPYELRDNTYFMSNPAYRLYYKDGQLRSTFNTRKKSWAVSTPKFSRNKWQKVDLSWHPQRGLAMYVDGVKLSSDISGREVKNDIQAEAPVYLGKALGDMNSEQYGNVQMDELTYHFASLEDLNTHGFGRESSINGKILRMDVIRDGRLINPYYDSTVHGGAHTFTIGNKRVVKLDGHKQYIFLGNNVICGGNLDDCPNGYTLRLYIRPDTLTDNMQLFGSFPISLFYKNSRLYAQVQTPTKTWTTSASGFDARRWQLVEVTWHPESGLQLYIDGRRVADTFRYYRSTHYRASSPKTYIGRSVNQISTDRYANAFIGNVEFWNARRTYVLNQNHTDTDYRITEPRDFTYHPYHVITAPPPRVYTHPPRRYTVQIPGREGGSSSTGIHIGARKKLEKAAHYVGRVYSIYDLHRLSSDFFTHTNTEMVHFWFATDAEHGLLWLSENEERKVWIGLRDGKLLFTVDFGGGQRRIQYLFPRNGPKLNDRRYHYVQVIREGNKIRFVVDGREQKIDTIYLDRNVQFMVPSMVYLGGARDPRSKTAAFMDRNYIGLLGDFAYHREDRQANRVLERDVYFYTFRDQTSGVDIVGPDFTLPPHTRTHPTRRPHTHPPPPTTTTTTRRPTPPPTYEVSFTRRNSFLKLPSWRAGVGATIAFDFRTLERRGLLLYNGPARGKTTGTYIAIEVYDGRLYLAHNLAGNHRRFLFSSSSIDDGEYHSVLVRIRARVLDTVIDGIQRSYNLPRSSALGFRLAGPLYLGYVQHDADLPWHIWSRLGFRGCIKNVRVNNQLQNLHSSFVTQLAVGVRRGCRPPKRHCLSSPCFSGPCYDTWTGYFCDCSATYYTGRHCDQIANFAMMNGNSTFVIRRSDTLRSHADDISVRFRTLLPDGVLFETKGRGTKSYLRLVLEDGRLRFITNIGGRKKSIYFGSRLNDDKWHTANIRRRANHIEVWVDKGKHKKDILDGANYRSWVDTVFVGMPRQSEKKNYRRYIGYLSNLYLNGIDLFRGHKHRTLFVPETGKHLPPLIFNPVTFKTRSSFATLPHIEANNARMTLSFLIKTIESSGLLLYNEGEGDKYIGIELANGRIQYNFNSGSAKAMLRVGTKQPLNDDKWHMIKIERSADGQQTIYVDNNNVPSASGIEPWNFKDRLFIGGLPKRKWEDLKSEWRVTSHQGYQGCFASLNMNGVVPDFYDEAAFDRGSISPGCLKSSCCGHVSMRVHTEPAMVCELDTCENHGMCIQEYVGYRCDCNMTSYVDAHCTEYGIAYRFGRDKKNVESNGIVIYSYPQGLYPSTDSEQLAFGFKTWKENGVLARVDSLSDGFMDVRLENGHVVVEYRMQDKVMRLVEDRRKFNDGQYHVVRLYRNGHNGTLYVDDYPGQSILHHGEAARFTRQQYIYLGALRGKGGALLHPFDGIISGFYYNGVRVLDHLKNGPIHPKYTGGVWFIGDPLPLSKGGKGPDIIEPPVVTEPPGFVTPHVPHTPAPPVAPPLIPVPIDVGGAGIAWKGGSYVLFPSDTRGTSGHGTFIPGAASPLTGKPVVAAAPAFLGTGFNHARAGAVVGAILGVLTLIGGLAWAFVRCKPGFCPCLPGGGAAASATPLAVSAPRAATNLPVVQAQTARANAATAATASPAAANGPSVANTDGLATRSPLLTTGSTSDSYDSATLRATGTFSNKGTIIGTPQTQRAFHRFDTSSVNVSPTAPNMSGTSTLNQNFMSSMHQTSGSSGSQIIAGGGGHFGAGGGSYRDGSMSAGVMGHDARYDTLGGRSLSGSQTGTLGTSFQYQVQNVHTVTMARHGAGFTGGTVGGTSASGFATPSAMAEEIRADCCLLTADGHHVVTGSPIGGPQVWNMRNGELVRNMLEDAYGSTNLHLACNDRLLVGTVNADLDVTEFSTRKGIMNRKLQIWDFDTGNPLTMTGDEYASALCMMNNDGDKVVFARTNHAGNSTSVVIWDLIGNQMIKEMRYDGEVGNQDYVHFLALSQNNRYVVAGFNNTLDGQGVFVVFDMTLASYNVVQPNMLSLDADPEVTAILPNDEAVTGLRNGDLVIWSLRTNQPSRQLLSNAGYHAHSRGVKAVALSRDNRFLVSASTDSTIKLWDMRTERQAYTLNGHSGEVWCCCISADNEIIVSGSNDGTIRLWRLRNGTQVCMFNAHMDVFHVQISDDKGTIVALGDKYGARKLIMLQVVRTKTTRRYSE